MKCNQSGRGFELVLPCPYPATITITPRAINSLLIIWKFDKFNRIRHNFFQAVAVSILLYGSTTRTLTKHTEKKPDGNYIKLWPILNKSRKQHPTKQQLYGYLVLISKTIQIRWTRHMGHCRRSKDKLIYDILLWTPSRAHAGVDQLTKTYIFMQLNNDNVLHSHIWICETYIECS